MVWKLKTNIDSQLGSHTINPLTCIPYLPEYLLVPTTMKNTFLSICRVTKMRKKSDVDEFEKKDCIGLHLRWESGVAGLLLLIESEHSS